MSKVWSAMVPEQTGRSQKPWEYIFFVDFLGHQSEAHVAKALERLREGSLFLRVLGSYPEAD